MEKKIHGSILIESSLKNRSLKMPKMSPINGSRPHIQYLASSSGWSKIFSEGHDIKVKGLPVTLSRLH